MQRNPLRPFRCAARPHRRAAVLIAAIGVLAILSMLVFALSYAQQSARSLNRLSLDRMQLEKSLGMALDHAMLQLDDRPTTLGESLQAELPMADEIQIRYTLRPAQPDEEAYRGGFLAPRPGDHLLIARAENQNMALSRVFLVNAGPRERRIPLKSASLSAADRD